MNRSQRRELAAETLAIIEAGRYVAASGAAVDIAEALERSVGASRVLAPAEVAALARSGGGRRIAPSLTPETTLAAAAALASAGAHPRIGVLNFASAKNPGGGFLSGADAQEESLARSSGLYAALQAAGEYYAANRYAGTALYTDYMIVSPGVPFFRDDAGALSPAPLPLTVITAPAPNVGALRSAAERAEAPIVLRRRMAAVLALAAEQEIDALILGAWGCGAFRGDPVVVAKLWSETLADAPAGAKPAHVRMAVFDPSPAQTNLRAFEAVFGPAQTGAA